ncbi:MAG: right-handed parallel beta-helix repeat-containing protein [Polyangiales bacterium]
MKVRSVLGIAALLAMAVSLGAAQAKAFDLIVTDTGDGTDIAPGNGVCEVTAFTGDCTLRAALAEAAANGQPSNNIFFDLPVGAVINTASTMSVASTVVIDGTRTAAGVYNTNYDPLAPAPQVEVNTTAGNIFGINGVDVTMRGLALATNNDGSNAGITVNQPGFIFEGNWMGLHLDGSDGKIGQHGIMSWPSGAGITLRRIGGPDITQRNVISNVSHYHIWERGSEATGTLIENNWLGVKPDGSGPVTRGLSRAGARMIFVQSPNSIVRNNVVVGTYDRASGTYIDGVDANIWCFNGDPAAVNTLFENNTCGFLPDGTPSRGFYIGIAWSANDLRFISNKIGQNKNSAVFLTESAGHNVSQNTIVNNGAHGVELSTGLGINASATISSNFIGVWPDGTADGNAGYGVRIGGSTSTALVTKNTIADNAQAGVYLAGGPASVTENFIGTNPSGDALVGNQGYGISCASSSGELTVSDNVIGGSTLYNVRLNNCDTPTISGNKIGTDVSGTLDFGAGLSGLQIFLGLNSFAPVEVTNNIVSGNGEHGVEILQELTEASITLKGNLIGVQADGVTALPNALNGVLVKRPNTDWLGDDRRSVAGRPKRVRAQWCRGRAGASEREQCFCQHFDELVFR